MDGKRFVTLNVGGHRFLTTAATLAAVEGSYFAKLAAAQQAALTGGSSRSGGSSGGGDGKGCGPASSEFFVDRNGKVRESGEGEAAGA